MGDFERAIEAYVDRGALLRRGEGVVAGVSGGVDSRVLLGVLQGLAAERQWRLVVAHFNHGLRGREADLDQRFVLRLAARLGLSCVCGTGDVRGLARKEGLSIEMAARRLRHDFLARVVRDQGMGVLALAHHADDQVELFCLRLLRGTSPAGLAGMLPVTTSPADPGIRLIRPLLGSGRAEILAMARSHRWRWREDASNGQVDILRNRVRRQLLPLLARQYQPAIRETVLRLMDLLHAESEVVERALPGDLAELEESGGLEGLPVALQRRWLVRELQKLGVPADYSLVEALRQGPGRAREVAGGRRVLRQFNGTVAEVEIQRREFSAGRLEVELDGKSGNVMFGGLKISWEKRVRKRGVGALPSRMAGVEWFDAGEIGSSMVLRFWQPGDRFEPIGLGRSVKLQDWFVNRKVPAAERRMRVLAEDARGRIFWVQGERISQAHRVTRATGLLLRWRWKENEHE